MVSDAEIEKIHDAQRAEVLILVLMEYGLGLRKNGIQA